MPLLYEKITGLHTGGKVVFFKEYITILIGILCSIFFVAGLFSNFIIKKIISNRSVSTLTLPKIQIGFLRKALLSTQLSITLLVILITAIIHYQMDFIEKARIGYAIDSVLYTKLSGLYGKKLNDSYDSLRIALTSNPSVESVSRVSYVFGKRFGKDRIRKSKEADINTELQVRMICADKYFITHLDHGLIQGRNFGNSSNEAIINESAAHLLDSLYLSDNSFYSGLYGDLKIVGVVKNFNYATLHKKIEPLIIVHRPDLANQLAFKILGDDHYNTLNFIETNLMAFFPNSAIEFLFLKDSFREQYKSENNLSNIGEVLSIIVLVMLYIAIQSLVGYIIETRNKEIVVRRILGAKHNQIIKLLSKEFLVILSISGVITCALGWWVTEYWLNLFEYKIDSWQLYFITALILSFFTIGALVLYNIRSNYKSTSIQSLRYN